MRSELQPTGEFAWMDVVKGLRADMDELRSVQLRSREKQNGRRGARLHWGVKLSYLPANSSSLREIGRAHV